MAIEQRCEQCGRVGTRGFKTLMSDLAGVPRITTCSNLNACRRRWPKPARDDD